MDVAVRVDGDMMLALMLVSLSEPFEVNVDANVEVWFVVLGLRLCSCYVRKRLYCSPLGLYGFPVRSSLLISPLLGDSLLVHSFTRCFLCSQAKCINNPTTENRTTKINQNNKLIVSQH